MSFTESVLAVVKKIPPGTVRSYRDIATLVGKPTAARAVARVMAENFDPAVPCHRVIRSDGSIGGYNRGGASAKYARLLAEGWTPKKQNVIH